MSRRRKTPAPAEPEPYPGFQALLAAMHDTPATCWDPATTGRYVSDIVGPGGENHPPDVPKLAALLAAVTAQFREQYKRANDLQAELNDLHRDIEGVGRLARLAEILSDNTPAPPPEET